MADITIVYWRDIPAQVLVGRGRRAAKEALPARFEQAIDRAAMKAGMAGTDAYLSQWRKETRPAPAAGDAAKSDQDVAKAAVREIEAAYDQARLKALIDTLGRA